MLPWDDHQIKFLSTKIPITHLSREFWFFQKENINHCHPSVKYSAAKTIDIDGK